MYFDPVLKSHLLPSAEDNADLCLAASMSAGKVDNFEVDNFEKDWNIPLLFHYTVLNGRFAKKGSKLCGHICPCVLKHNNTTNSKSYGDEFEQKDVILLSIWLTRCNSPTIHLVVYVPGRNNCVLLKGNVIAFLKTRYCDTSATFDEEAIKK